MTAYDTNSIISTPVNLLYIASSHSLASSRRARDITLVQRVSHPIYNMSQIQWNGNKHISWKVDAVK